MSPSPHAIQVHPTEGSSGRLARHAAHCRVRGSFSSVQVVHDHSGVVDDDDETLVWGLEYKADRPCDKMEDDGIGARDGFVIFDFDTAVKLVTFLDRGTSILDGPSNMTTSESESSPSLVRSITLSSILSPDALSASRWASSPEPHAFSSRVRLSAA